LRFKATAARPPAPKPVAAVPAAPVDSGPPTVESLGRQLREVLPTRRLHSISLCDHEANVLWLSEGALGPDEHTLVTDALGVLTADTSLASHEMGLEDGRFAFFLAVRAPTADLVGIAMILADGRALGDDTLERMAAGPVRAIMLRLAVLLKPNDAHPKASPTAAAAPVPAQEDSIDLALSEDVASITAAAPAAAPSITPSEVNDILEFELSPQDTSVTMTRLKFSPPVSVTDTSSEMMSLEFLEASGKHKASATAKVKAQAGAAVAPPAPPAAPPSPLARLAPKASPAPAARIAAEPPPAVVAAAPVVIAPVAEAPAAAPPAPVAVVTPAASAPAVASSSDPNLLLEVLPFAKLRAGGQTRRYQVLPRLAPGQRDPAALDALVLQRLMSWLAAHRTAWNSQPTGFTVNLSIATLEDERFAQKITAALNSHGISGETLGFEITEALCTQRRAQVERFINQCEKVGAWIVIDDFSFDAQVLPLLRSKAVRLVKIDPKLSSSALKDKLSQAMVVATVQAAKVLGIHCAAKKVDSQAALQWLTAIGMDFAQGAALAGSQTLDSLASSPDPTGLAAVLRPN
jgi:EAL domain-containing protein (putative c-di-GMP-specific phosphodiesterase class I)